MWWTRRQETRVREQWAQEVDRLHGQIAAALTYVDDALAQLDADDEQDLDLVASLSRARARLVGDQLHDRPAT